MLTLEIERGAGRLRYAVSGRNHGQPLLLLHPLGADLEVWRQQLPELEQRFRVVRMDLRGHGGSALAEGAPAPCAMTDLLDDACAVLDAQGIARAHWCGLSLGGAVALQAAVTAPQRVRRLVLADTAASFPPRERWDERIATVLAHGMEPLVEPIVQRWFTAPFMAASPDAVDAVRAMLRATQPRGYAEACDALRGFDLAARLGEVRAPTLVIAGAQDVSTPPERAEELVDGIAGAGLEVLDAAHLSNVEQAADFTTALVRFLAD
ncbi:MAG: 3-oxoadipate enol-lactonase [Gammaproteobacteria bacterium]|jgi:3-oxoadipate enol-lactonase